ncbi:hypothetical protein VTN77DRAFT_2334 [Rasamsonia byssochlamydoides]|uniref:uncharacterized protein n=1 Tax=Rasamsonia byssochlamydoides TaxID=89139 RepID=UPI0037445CD1
MEPPNEDESILSSDSEREDESTTGAHLEEKSRRRVQNARFETLLSEFAVSMTSEQIKSALKKVPSPEGSTVHLIAEQDFASAITDPREYQIELFEKAKKQNTIAVLDTGSGKTLIAVLLLKHIIQNELVDRGLGKPPRISFFLVDSVTLVYQQTAVLRNNIGQKVAHLFGAMGLDLWSKEIWNQYFKQNMVIVCTAEILHQCLLNSYIQMENINLLIFDEAHHTKKDHPYARIIKDSYLKEIPEKRPRIFGMTASPIDAKGDVVKAAVTLEKLLDSQIATTSNLTLLRQVVNRPTEQVWKYPRLDPPFKTALYECLETRFGDVECLAKIFKFSLNASSELGEWCSDRVWAYVLAEEVLPKLQGSVSRAFNRSIRNGSMDKVENEINRLKDACQVVAAYKLRSHDISHQLSPKVQLLRDELSKHFGRAANTKCIVFTKQRHTARLLGDLFTSLDIPNLRPGVLIGVRSGDDAGMNTTYHQQFKAMMRFRKGELNCLFATSVAEEGLDIPDCNLVVRFDLYHTLIQYVQSRGRARHVNSTYAHMVELDNLEHETRLEEVREAEDMMRRFLPLKAAMVVQTKDLDILTTFTLRVFRDLFHKTYERDTEAMPYWLVPAVTPIEHFHDDLKPGDIIDWNTLEFVQENDEITWTDAKVAGTMLDRFVFDKWDGRYRYFTIAIDRNLRPSDPPPSFVPRRRHMDNIMNYCLSLFKNSRTKFLAQCDWDQPVLNAELVSLRRNLLDKMTDQEKGVERRSVICLEPLTISAIPSSVAASCFAFPAIMSRFESYLIAQEACESLDLDIRLPYALEALTKDSDNTEEHRSEQIHFQRGMGKNYERLEFLGDCFLKMGTSISLFAQNPHDQEFDYHVNRMCLICNKNLFKTAKERRLYEFIRSQGFSRRGWYPKGLKLLHGKSSDNTASSDCTHALGEKTIADVCEALIGASLLSGGPEHRFDMAVKAVTALVNSSNHDVQSWREYYALYSLPPYQIQAPDGFERDLAQRVEEKLGYHFKYPRLLRSAFTHPSYPSAWAKVPCYQRLEFLGDSLLDMWLTEHKMAMVSNKFLGTLAVQLGLHTHLQHFSNPLQSQITNYAEEIQTAHQESLGAKEFWVATEDPPKCLPDMVEAYLGAIFVDSCFCFDVIEDFYRTHIRPYFEDMSLYDSFANKHPTTFLHNRLSKDFGCTNYCLKAGEIPTADGAPTIVLAAVLVHNTVLAKETASSGRYAKIKASEAALGVLEGLHASEFRDQYQCDCLKVEQDDTLANGAIGSAVPAGGSRWTPSPFRLDVEPLKPNRNHARWSKHRPWQSRDSGRHACRVPLCRTGLKDNKRTPGRRRKSGSSSITIQPSPPGFRLIPHLSSAFPLLLYTPSQVADSRRVRVT